MRTLILSSLVSVLLVSAGHAETVVSERAAATRGHAEGFQTVLVGSASQMPAVKTIYNSASLNGAYLPTAAPPRDATRLGASQGRVVDLLPAEGGSSGAMLLAGAMVMAALVLRRIS